MVKLSKLIEMDVWWAVLTGLYSRGSGEELGCELRWNICPGSRQQLVLPGPKPV